MLTFSILLTVVYIAHHVRLRRRGEPVSFRKLRYLLGVFLAATYYLYVALTDFLVELYRLVGVPLLAVLRDRAVAFFTS